MVIISLINNNRNSILGLYKETIGNNLSIKIENYKYLFKNSKSMVIIYMTWKLLLTKILLIQLIINYLLKYYEHMIANVQVFTNSFIIC